MALPSLCTGDVAARIGSALFAQSKRCDQSAWPPASSGTIAVRPESRAYRVAPCVAVREGRRNSRRVPAQRSAVLNRADPRGGKNGIKRYTTEIMVDMQGPYNCSAFAHRASSRPAVSTSKVRTSNHRVNSRRAKLSGRQLHEQLSILHGRAIK